MSKWKNYFPNDLNAGGEWDPWVDYEVAIQRGAPLAVPTQRLQGLPNQR